MEQETFPIFSFSDALRALLTGDDIRRGDLRLTLKDKTIFMIDEDGVLSPYMATHKDILANDWRIITRG